MSIQGKAVAAPSDVATDEPAGRYVDTLALVERLHRLLLDVNPVQALLLFNIGDNEVTAGELKSRGYYQGSNVSYNLKKLVEAGYMHHQRCGVDRRAVRIRLTDKGRAIRESVGALFDRHATDLATRGLFGGDAGAEVANGLRRIERYWTEQIRYIY